MPYTFQTAGGVSAQTVVLKISEGLKQNVTDMRYAAERQKGRMIQRAGRGLDTSGQAFAAYKPAYAKRKEKSGRDSTIVDLTWSGRMLKAMVTSRVTLDEFVIGIYGDEGLRAAVHDGGLGHAPKRQFMGASDSDRRLILKDIAARRLVHDGGLGHAPKRQFMGASDSDRRLILKDIAARRLARANQTALNAA